MKLTNLVRTHLVSIWVLAVLLLGTLTAQAASTTFEIEPQDLSGALKAFAVQSHREIFFAPELARGRRSNGVKGTFDDLKALNIILEGTGLDFSVTASNAILVRDPTTKSESSRQGGAPTTSATGGTNNPSSRLAQTDSTQDQNVGSATVPDSNSKREEKDELSEIVVTGTHIAGIGPVGSPLTVYTRDDIDQSGAATLDQFARQIQGNFSNVDTVANLASNAKYGPLSNDTTSNLFAGSAFNLHGLGASATLTLLNGNRLSPAGTGGSFSDISQIPLSAIDHIEVLSDGASAIYGADAVAGVVNIITRKDFDGAETSVRYGAATDGGAIERAASQLLGHSWGSGNAFLNYEYDDQGGLLASQRSYIPPLGGPYSLLPESHRNSVLGSFSQSFGSGTTIAADALYSDRDFGSVDTADNPYIDESDQNSGHVKQASVSLRLDQPIIGDWAAHLSGNYSDIRQFQLGNSEFTGDFTGTSLVTNESDSKLSELDVLVSGSVFRIPGGDIKLSVGGAYRDERFDSVEDITFSGENSASVVPNLQRHVTSAFAETFVPIVGQQNSITGIQRLDISVAGRYDDYTDFGSTVNPKVGIAWEPASGLYVRGSYGTSFRAPLLSQIGSTQLASAAYVSDPAAATGVTDTVTVQGGNPDLTRERSSSFTTGVDLVPAELPNSEFSVTYFHIHFTDQISTPQTSTGGAYELTDPALAPFIVRDPPLSEVVPYFNTPGFVNGTGLGPTAVKALLFLQYTNIGTTKNAGLDFNAKYALPIGPGKLGFSVYAERMLQNEFQTEATQPFFYYLNTFGAPPKWKGRFGTSWSQEHLTASVFVNYVNSYENQLFSPPQSIGSFTTGDLSIIYRTGEKVPLYAIRNLTLGFAVNNVTNAKPPFAEIPSVDVSGAPTIPFDPTNASPVGRLISLVVTKRW